jgi:hypothetical protein
MTVTASWTDPSEGGALDRDSGQILREQDWDALLSNLLVLGGTTGAEHTGGWTIAGDVTIFRPGAPTTGVVFLGNAGNRYLYYDGANYVLPSAEGTLNGSFIVTENNTRTLNNKTLNSPTLATPNFTSVLTITTSGGLALPPATEGAFRAYKAWGGTLRLTGSSVVGPGGTGGTTEFTLQNGDSVTMIASGGTWWVV